MANDFFDSVNGNIFFDLAENISQMIWVANEDGKIIWFNKRWRLFTGKNPEENELWQYYHPQDKDQIQDKINKDSGELKDREGTFRIQNKDGEYHWFLIRIVPNFEQESGTLRWFATHTNVNRLVQLENDIINEKALLQKVIDTIPAMVTIYDPSNMSIKLNPAFEKLTGWTNEDANQRNIMELVYPNPSYRKEVMEFMQNKRASFTDIEMITKDGKILNTSWANERISDGRQVGIGIDITERKKMEEDIKEANMQLLNLNRLMENLLYMAAHDLKSPIANLKLIMNLIHDEKELEEKLNYFPKINTMIKRLEGVIDGLSDFIESQQQQSDFSIHVNISELLRDVLSDFAEEIQNRSVQIDQKISVNAIHFEYSVLKNILKNLISNSLKYAEIARKTKIEIIFEQVDGYILLMVTDNGIGIDLQKYGKNLFRPFKRFSSQAWGSGIGLFIVKNFVERKGGFIEVESEPGKGTTFSCYLKEYEN